MHNLIIKRKIDRNLMLQSASMNGAAPGSEGMGESTYIYVIAIKHSIG